jgi:hypothetical protein
MAAAGQFFTVNCMTREPLRRLADGAAMRTGSLGPGSVCPAGGPAVAALGAPVTMPWSARIRSATRAWRWRRHNRPRRDWLRRDWLRRDWLRPDWLRGHDPLWWLAAALTASGAALIPWLVGLAICLPASTRACNWSTAWAGLDALEALGLLGTGVLLIRRDARYRLTAAATTTLLLADAWFDVMTSAPGPSRMLAIAMALVVELPVAAVCAALAARGYRDRPDPDFAAPAHSKLSIANLEY